jgi:hypothetical protein
MKKAFLSALILSAAISGAIAAPAAETTSNPEAGYTPTAATGPVWVNSPTAVLYSNGAVQTAATGGGAAGNEPVSATTAPDTSFGATCIGNATGFRLADDFTVPAGGWTVNKVTVFGYQTQAAPGGSTASTMTGGILQIWRGVPGAAGSTVVFGDATTNRQTATSFSGVWRAASTTLTNVQRPIMAVEFGGLTVNLTPGTYYADYGITGSGASGPFCPPNNVAAATNNGQQFNATTSVWGPVTDGGSLRPLDFPFVIDGVPTAAPVVRVPTPGLNFAGMVALVLALGALATFATRRS